MTITQWDPKDLQSVTGWALLTPPADQALTTIGTLGAFTIEELADVIISEGYLPASGTEWTRV